MTTQTTVTKFTAHLIFGFVAGFLATLIFHQLVRTLIWGLGMVPSAPFSMTPTKPFGVPAVISLSFWGGVWGIVFAMLDTKFPRRAGYWLTSFLFGAILPSLVALLLVLPLKGQPMGGGWNPAQLVIAFILNGAWGIGTAVFLRMQDSWLNASRTVR
ncbi:MAG TPA: hypothetical protein VHO84_05350 [Syntrophorhabdaceae bacterium]|nr:hypothetical protein [Syntrophorhabdaceae bacterium]